MYEQYQSDIEREQEKRKLVRQAMMDNMGSPATQMVSGRAVPYSPIQGLSQIAKAMIYKSSLKDSDAREATAQAAMDAERKSAVNNVMGTFTGRDAVQPTDISGNEVMGAPTRDNAAIEENPGKAAIMAASDPYTQDISPVITAMMKGKSGKERGSFYTTQHSPEGTLLTNARTGEQEFKPYPSGFSGPIKYDVPTKRDLASAAEGGKTGFEDNPLTPAQKAVDTAFGKDYADYKAAGGYADVAKGLEQLKEVSGKVVKDDLTGPIMSIIPDVVQKFTNSEAIAARGLVEEVVQRNLRLILGAQFTQKEGERLITRAYDEGLSPEENQRRLQRLMTAIKEAADAKESAGKYYEENGTLRGWTGKLATESDFNNLSYGDTAEDKVIEVNW